MERAQKQSLNRRSILFSVITLTVASAIVFGAAQQAEAQQRPAPGPSAREPNILMIMADDIGWFNVSAYNHGIMGYRTPNIDRIAKKAHCSPTGTPNKLHRGRAAFITGQSPIPTGRRKLACRGRTSVCDPKTRVSLKFSSLSATPAASSAKTTSATRPNFCRRTTASMSSSATSTDLNAEEEPENPDYPKNPQFRQRFGPRGVVKS